MLKNLDAFSLKLYYVEHQLMFKLREELTNKSLGDQVEIEFIKSYLLKLYVYEFNWDTHRVKSNLVPQVNFVDLK